MDMVARLSSALGDRYRVVREVGRGGMAMVFVADDLKHGRRVALKVLRPELAAAMGEERFLREIEIAARLNHPSILGLHDSGEAEGLLYFVMPFVEGESLRERLDREGPLSLEEGLRITRAVGDALSYAHGQGLVHRDIKPENILFQAGHPLVTDFGIAMVATEAQERLTQTGIAIGTLTYMSPEQIAGDREVDARTDVYALGCVLYEMLTGHAPFAGSTAQAMLAKKLLGGAPDLSDARADVPATVQAVLAHALTADPDRRLATASRFVEELTHATSAIAIEEAARRRRRRGALRLGAAGGAISAVALAGSWLAATLAAPDMERIAVLPLTNAANAPDQDFFIQGIHEDLVLELARAGMRVKSAGAVAQYAGTNRPVRDIATELAVEGVIQGSASHVGDSVTINLQLVDGETDELIWLESFAAHARDVVGLYRRATLAIADEIGLGVADELRLALSSASPVDPAAYEALLQGRFHYQRLTEEGLQTSLEYFELALERDPELADAYVGIAAVWLGRAQMGFISTEVANRAAGAAMARARELDPGLSRVQGELALRLTWSEWRWAEAEAAFQRTLADNPTDAQSRAYYSQLLLYLDRDGEALQQIERAVETEPANALIQGLYAMDLNFLARYEAAETVLRRVLARNAEDPIALSTLRTTYHLMGRHDEGLEMWRASYASRGDDEAVAALERGHAQGGYHQALRSVAELFVERARTTEIHVTPWQIATLYTRADDDGPALDYLERAYQARDQNMPYISIDPIFDHLRDEPRFQALVDSLGLPR
jgi:serine/threonine-protein kinase